MPLATQIHLCLRGKIMGMTSVSLKPAILPRAVFNAVLVLCIIGSDVFKWWWVTQSVLHTDQCLVQWYVNDNFSQWQNYSILGLFIVVIYLY